MDDGTGKGGRFGSQIIGNDESLGLFVPDFDENFVVLTQMTQKYFGTLAKTPYSLISFHICWCSAALKTGLKANLK